MLQIAIQVILIVCALLVLACGFFMFCFGGFGDNQVSQALSIAGAFIGFMAIPGTIGNVYFGAACVAIGTALVVASVIFLPRSD